MATEQKPANAVAVIATTLLTPEFAGKISSALPANVTQARFMSAAIAAVRNFREINECDRNSVYNAVLDAARAGLLPDGKQGALVAFNTKQPDGSYAKKAQFLPMVAGVIHQLGNAGINAFAVSVYENDICEIMNDENGQHLRHVPKVFGDRGKRVGAVAAAKTSNGGTYVEAIDMPELDRIRAASKQKDKQGNPAGIWLAWPERMEQKSALHRLARRIPKPDGFVMAPEPEEDDAIEVEAAAATPAVVETPAPKQQAKRPSALQAVVDAVDEEQPPYDEVI
jgi:recombinational DNA repair protein RecT